MRPRSCLMSTISLLLMCAAGAALCYGIAWLLEQLTAWLATLHDTLVTS